MSKIKPSDSFSEFDDLTVYETLEELIGEEKTKALCCQHGGRTVYIPPSAKDGHWLVTAVGREAADIVCRHYRFGRSGVRIVLPLGRGKGGGELLSTISRMTDEGKTASEINRALRIHERTVYRIRARIVEARCKRMGKHIRLLLKAGLSTEEIAAKLHVSVFGIKPVIRKIQEMDRIAAEAAQ